MPRRSLRSLGLRSEDRAEDVGLAFDALDDAPALPAMPVDRERAEHVVLLDDELDRLRVRLRPRERRVEVLGGEAAVIEKLRLVADRPDALA